MLATIIDFRSPLSDEGFANLEFLDMGEGVKVSKGNIIWVSEIFIEVNYQNQKNSPLGP